MSKTNVDHLQDLKEIRSIMERSSRFISLSGLSGIFAGIFALLGAAVAHYYMTTCLFGNNCGFFPEDPYLFFLINAAVVVTLAVSAGIFFTTRQARKKGQSIWDSTSRRLIINLAIPLAAGGVFCLALLYHGFIGFVAPATLIFYGLALLNGSKFTLDNIRYLAISEIVLGLIAMFYIGSGLLFWTIGFGVLHIVYGTVMYLKYER
ncbi:MAG: hypothetical protein ACK40G_17985 [Cytophagaceae bacterium]